MRDLPRNLQNRQMGVGAAGARRMEELQGLADHHRSMVWYHEALWDEVDKLLFGGQVRRGERRYDGGDSEPDSDSTYWLSTTSEREAAAAAAEAEAEEEEEVEEEEQQQQQQQQPHPAQGG